MLAWKEKVFPKFHVRYFNIYQNNSKFSQHNFECFALNFCFMSHANKKSHEWSTTFLIRLSSSVSAASHATRLCIFGGAKHFKPSSQNFLIPGAIQRITNFCFDNTSVVLLIDTSVLTFVDAVGRSESDPNTFQLIINKRQRIFLQTNFSAFKCCRGRRFFMRHSFVLDYFRLCETFLKSADLSFFMI